jgi:Protein of unknown function (DUF2500)
MFDNGPSMGGGFGIMFTIVPILIVIVFVIVIGGIIMNGARYFKNARSPKQTLYARVIAKRLDVRNRSHNHGNGIGGVHSRTYYYITLEFDNGQRKEYLDIRSLYGLVVEGDQGYAAVQGDWIVAFERAK